MLRPAYPRKRRLLRPIVVLGTALFVVAGSAAAQAAPREHNHGPSQNWPMGGANLFDTRSNPLEHAISAANVGRLALKWAFTTHGDVSATAAVVDGAIYFPDWGGYLNKVDAQTGRLIWQTQISQYSGIAGDTARHQPSRAGRGGVYR